MKTVEEFKSIIIPKIVSFMHENLNYRKDRYISKSMFKNSQLLRKKPNLYQGDDLATGKIGDTSIRFSEIEAAYETSSSRDKGAATIIFKGLFFIADFNKKFTGKTVLLPDYLERFLGRFGKKLQSLDPRWGKQINNVINLALGIVDALNLNERIWDNHSIEKTMPRPDKSADVLFRKGAKLFNSGEHQKAIKMYSDSKDSALKYLESKSPEKIPEVVLKKGNLIAFCNDTPGNSYWEYERYAWYLSFEPKSVQKVCTTSKFIVKVEAGEINAEMVED